MEFPRLDSGAISSKEHPFLFFSPKEIGMARERWQQPKYREARINLEKETDTEKGFDPPRLESEWWESARDREWKQIYPEVFRHTSVVPSRISRPMTACALRGLITGEQEFVDAALRLLKYLSEYSFEYEHYDVGMNYSIWGYQCLMVYDAFFEELNEDEREALDAFFTRLGTAVLRNDEFWIANNIGGGINNHLAWHKMTLGMLGAFYDKPEWIETALHGRRGLVELLELGLMDDGLWCESALNYHFTAIVPMVLLADALRRIDYPEDLYQRVLGNGRTLRQPFEAILGTLFPDGTIPPLGDAYGRRAAISDIHLYSLVAPVYREPTFAWVTDSKMDAKPQTFFYPPAGVSPRAPRIASRLYPEHGYAFLRTQTDEEYWGGDGWCAFLNYDRAGVHANLDALSLMLFGQGRLLVPDVESISSAVHAFSSKVQRELNRTTLAQNTVMVDGRDQAHRGDRLRLVEFRDLPHEKVVSAADEAGMVYPGVRQQRTVVVTNEYVLDVFELVSDATHSFEWITHTFGDLSSQNLSLDLFGIVWSATPVPPRNWLHYNGQGQVDSEWWGEWEEEGVHLRLTMAGCPGSHITACEFPRDDQWTKPGFPMLIVRRGGERTVYAAVYQAARDKIPKAAVTRLEDEDGFLVYRVSGPWGKRKHLIRKIR